MDYAQLVAAKTTLNSIRGWINWSIAPAEDILGEAESLIYSLLRVPQMEILDEGTILTGVTELEMPADFIQAKSFRRIGETAGIITILDRQHFEERLGLDTDGTFFEAPPTECTIYGEPMVAHFNTKADQNIDYRLLYYGEPAHLSGSNTTNWLTRRYPFLLRSTCLYYGFLYKKEFAAAQLWQTNSMGLIQVCNGNADMTDQINQLENYWTQ